LTFKNDEGPGTPGPFWKADTINRSIEEERRVQVLVRDNNVDQPQA
jgi:hypothetical protein